MSNPKFQLVDHCYVALSEDRNYGVKKCSVKLVEYCWLSLQIFQFAVKQEATLLIMFACQCLQMKLTAFFRRMCLHLSSKFLYFASDGFNKYCSRARALKGQSRVELQIFVFFELFGLKLFVDIWHITLFLFILSATNDVNINSSFALLITTGPKSKAVISLILFNSRVSNSMWLLLRS